MIENISNEGINQLPPVQAGASADFSMVVWLKGDEPYFNEFSIDADTAMKILGIKRSRLTQISGKELRVGRARIDRYIRPLYRPQDIEEYINWTKPTSTSKKSSEFIEQATAELVKKSELLEASLSEPFSETAHKIAQVSANLELLLGEQTAKLNRYISGQFDECINNFENRLKNIERTLLATSSRLDASDRLMTRITQLESINQNLIQQNATINIHLENIANKIEALEPSKLKSQLQAIAHNCNNIAIAIEEAAKKKPPRLKASKKRLRYFVDSKKGNWSSYRFIKRQQVLVWGLRSPHP